MAGEIHSAFSDTSRSEADILAMFNDGTGFSDASLNSSGKNIGGKTASSSYASASVKPQIQAFITRVVNDVFLLMMMLRLEKQENILIRVVELFT